MPHSTVSCVSGSRTSTSVGSASSSFCSPSERRSSSARVLGFRAIAMTGLGTRIGANTTSTPGAASVSPVRTASALVTAPIMPASNAWTSSSCAPFGMYRWAVRTSTSRVLSWSGCPARISPDRTRIIDTLPRYGSITFLNTLATKGLSLPSGGIAPAATRSGMCCSTPRTPWAMKSISGVMPIASVAEVISAGCSAFARTARKNAALRVNGSRSWSSRYFIIRSSSGLDDRLDEPLAVGARDAVDLVGDRTAAALSPLPGVRDHVEQVDDAPEVGRLTDRHLHGGQVTGQARLDVAHGAEEVGVLAVHLVDDHDRVQLALVGAGPDALRTHRHARHGGHDHKGAVRGGHGAADLTDEVGVPGRVDEVEQVLAPGHGVDGGVDRDLAPLLLGRRIGGRVRVFDAAHLG